MRDCHRLGAVVVLIVVAGCADDEREIRNEAYRDAEAERSAIESLEGDAYLKDIRDAGLGNYSRDDALSDGFSVDRAADFIDGVAVSWGNHYGCVTCHTNGFYLTLPASIASDRPAYRKAREQAQAYMSSWPSMEDAPHDDTFLEDTYVVATSAFLAISELQTDGELSASTVDALDRAWKLQEPEGHWKNWVVCNWPPFESDYHFGVTLMAIVWGMAPDSYRETASAREGMTRLRRYLAENEPVHPQNRGMLLWASKYVDDLLTDEQRAAWVEELRELQRDDGGWASGDLGAWRQRDGTPDDPEVHVESDGYGTGFVMFALMEAGMPATDPAIERGVSWLKTHQRERGHWWTQSLRNDPYTANFLTHTGTTFALKALESAGATADAIRTAQK